MFEPLDIFDTDRVKQQTERLSEEDMKKINVIYAAAKSNNHRVALISNSLEMYSPPNSISLPVVYDLARYGTDKFNYHVVMADFVVKKWIRVDGTEEEVEETVTDSGAYWFRDLPVPTVEEDGFLFEDSSVLPEKEPWEIVREIADKHWRAPLTGTPLGELWELIENQGEAFHCNEAFYVAVNYIEESGFPIEEIKKWVKADCLYDEAEILYRAGLTAEEAGTSFLDTGINVAQKYFADKNWTVDDAAIYLQLTDDKANLDDVITIEEAAELWGQNVRELIRQVCFEEHVANRLRLQKRIRKSGNTLLITKQAMFELYGEAKV